MEPTRRFSNRATDYVSSRPGYPEAAFEVTLTDGDVFVAADVGAGTGISARALADRGVDVFAVEPNAAMRAVAAPHPRVRWISARAEATGLATGGVQLVLCAQAFHWFDRPAAFAEFARILRPAGRLALLWNYADPDDPDDPVAAGYNALVGPARETIPASRKTSLGDPFTGQDLFRDVRHEQFQHVQVLDRAGLIARALSSSFCPKEGELHQRIVNGLHELFETHAGADGTVRFGYRTTLWLARSASLWHSPC